jgi:hypothetical protein
MSRIPTHTVDDAPAASRPFLQALSKSSPTGHFLNLHAQMANSPAVLAAYMSLRAAVTEHGKFDPKMSAALTLATAGAVGNEYMIGIAGRLAQMNGWTEAEIAALRAGTPTSEAKLNVLIGLIRDAASNSGSVSDARWNAARQAGWSDEQLTDAFAYLGLTLFTGYFLNYAQTDSDPLW